MRSVMMPMLVPTLALIPLSLFLSPEPVTGQDAHPLSLGALVEGRSYGDDATEYVFDAQEAGILTVVLRGMGEADLKLSVTDASGQTLTGAESDQDLQGAPGAEQVTVDIRTPGEYRIKVSSWFGSGRFRIGGAWIPFPEIEIEPDADGMPTGAQALEPGSPILDSLDPAAGDGWDWFVVASDEGGVVTVITEATHGDLVLEAFSEDAFEEAVDGSDQDMGGVNGNESVTIRLEPGAKLYFRVSAPYGSDGAIEYAIRAGII